MAKKKTKGWLDKFEEPEMQLGGNVYSANYVPQAENGLEASTDGFTDQGFNYNGAWGGTMEDGGDIPQAQNGIYGGLNFLEPTSKKLPEGYNRKAKGSSTEYATSIGGTDGELAYLIPEFKYGKLLDDPKTEFRRTGDYLGGPFKTWQEADQWERDVRHPYVEKGQSIPTPLRRWGKDFENGGNVPQAQLGEILPASFPLGDLAIKAASKVADWFSSDKPKTKPTRRPSSSSEDDNETELLQQIINIKDPRKIRKTTGQPINPNVDLVSGEYDAYLIKEALQDAKNYGLSKEDAWNLAAIDFQETGWGKTDSNMGHVLAGSQGGDTENSFLNAYLNKMKEADRLKITDPEMRLQVYNGLGLIKPETEQNYHKFKMKKIYGVPVPKEGLSMKKNPLYGKQIVDLRDNVLKQNPDITSYIESLYGEEDGVPKKAMGGNIPGSVGFSYARTKGIPSKGPHRNQTYVTDASAQNGAEMSFYQNGLDWTPRNISRDGSEIPQAEDGEQVTLEDLLKVVNKRAASDNTNSGIQAKVSKQIGAQKSSNQKAEQQVQTLINKAGYSEPHARRAVRTKTDTQANKALENIDTDVYRTQMHPDYNPNIPVDQQSYLLNDNSLRARLLRGSNMLTNTGNPLTDFAAGMVTAPGRSFANLTMDAGNRYFNPNNTGLGNFANFAEDVVNVAPSIIPKAAGALGQVPNAVNQGARTAGKFLTESTPLKNAYKLNPYAFKPNPEMMYRGIGERGAKDALESRVFRSPNKNNNTTTFWADSDNFKRAELSSWWTNPSEAYIAEYPKNAANFEVRYSRFGENEPIFEDFHKFAGSLPIEKGNILKRHWLKGYKEVPKPTSISSAAESVPTNYPSFKQVINNPENINSKHLSGLIKKETDWLRSPEYLKRKMQATGRSEASIKKESEEIINNINNTSIEYTGATEGAAAGVYTPTDGVKIYNGGVNNPYYEGVLDHEVKHAFSETAYQNDPIMDYFRNRGYTNYPKVNLNKGLKDQVSNIFGGNWVNQAAEQQVTGRRMMDLIEKTQGLKRGTELNASNVDDLINHVRQDQVNNSDIVHMMLGFKKKFGNDYSKNLSQFLNKAYTVAPYAVPAAIGAGALQQKKQGGEITKDDNGYWNPENWGKPVEIGSSNITMQGVNQPLIGISDTGDVQMMYPGEDYTFDGESVTEYPVKKNGGWLDEL